MNTGQVRVSLTDAKTHIEKAEKAVESYADATQRISIHFSAAADAKFECRKALREAIDKLHSAVLSLD